MTSTRPDISTDDILPSPHGLFSRLWWTPQWAYLLSSVITLGFFAADAILPRGETAAIGYCVVPFLAAGTRSRRFTISITIVCTVLTWAAYFVEPVKTVQWASVFDRTLVTGVIWFVLALVLWRTAIIVELVRQRKELKNVTWELERSNGELSTFASVVAHDLRGPLNTIGLFTQLLSDSQSVRDDAECSESLDSIEAELTQMTGFIQKMLDYGRLGAGEIQVQECDCNVLLEGVRRHLRADMLRSDAEVSNDPLPIIQADPTLMSELFQNLIENSIKYSGTAAPRVHVSVTQQPQGWVFRVHDNGRGIRPEDCRTIFEPFRQNGTGKSPDKGVGLGLATCKRIVERHGGRIEVQSSPGEGTAFVFTMPRGSLASAAVAA